METIAKKLLAANKECQLIVLAGKNEDLYQALEAIALLHPNRLFPIGFTQEVDALMACADLVITKPGGLSTSECLVMGLPMVLINPIPGQEERNAAVLLQEGVAIRADDADALLYRTQQLLANEEKFNQMKIRARALAKPDAAKVVMQHVIDHLAHAPISQGV
jgi:processive 1,2-diacylglycerol beta-glucosyltransferase